MATVLTDFSTFDFSGVKMEYINSDRGVSPFTLTNEPFSLENGINDPSDLNFNFESINILTNKTTLTNVFTSESLEEDGLVNVDYFYRPDEQETLPTLETKNRNTFETQYLITCPLETLTDDYTISYNPIALKTHKQAHFEGVDTELLSLTADNTPKQYLYMSFGSNQKSGTDPVLAFEAETQLIKFKTDTITGFHYPYDKSVQAGELTPVEYTIDFENTSLISSGAIGGDSPMYSDMVLVSQKGYPTHTNAGIDGVANGSLLCVWLSADGLDDENNYQWMERWYDGSTVSDDVTAHLSIKTGEGCEDKGIWDIPTTQQFKSKGLYFYDRLGLERIQQNIDAEKSHELFKITEWTNTLTYNDNYLGEVIGVDNLSSSELNLDGLSYAYIPIQEDFLEENEITVSVDAFKEDWTKGSTNQLVGNFDKGGFGIFYDTGNTTPILSIIGDNGVFYSLNEDLYRIFEKDIKEATEFTETAIIDYVVTDSENSRWIYDSANKKILKLDVDDIIVNEIDLSANSDVVKMEINSFDRLIFMDVSDNSVSIYDSDANSVSVESFTSNSDIFTLGVSEEIILDKGRFLEIDSEGALYKIVGKNLYKKLPLEEWNPVFHFPQTPTDVKIDAGDNVYVAYSGNKIIKLDKDNRIVYHKSLFNDSKIAKETILRIGLIKKRVNGTDQEFLVVIFGTYQYILYLDAGGNAKQFTKFSKILRGKKCDINAIDSFGDFTGYNLNRKTKKDYNGNPISISNPAITYKIKLRDSEVSTIKKEFSIPTKEFSFGWHVFGLVFDRKKQSLAFYIDGRERGAEIYSQDYAIALNQSSPLLVGGNSGKLGTEKDERELTDNQFFIGTIDNVYIYKKAYSEFFMNHLAERRLKRIDDLVWNIPVQKRLMFEQITAFFTNRKNLPKSNHFAINIRNSGITDLELQSAVEQSLRDAINSIKPVNANLLQINWLDKTDLSA